MEGSYITIPVAPCIDLVVFYRRGPDRDVLRPWGLSSFFVSPLDRIRNSALHPLTFAMSNSLGIALLVLLVVRAPGSKQNRSS